MHEDYGIRTSRETRVQRIQTWAARQAAIQRRKAAAAAMKEIHAAATVPAKW